MGPIILLSLAFLASPMLAYVVIALDIPLRIKIILGIIAVVLLTIVPILVLIFGGGGGG